MLHQKAPTHFLIFTASFVLIIVFFIFYFVSEAVILDPKDAIHHTTVVYYDGQFSETSRREDLKTALYVLNHSDEVIYATVYEYDKFGKEKYEVVQISGQQNQFMKTEGPGVIYLNNSDSSAQSVIKFSRWIKVRYFFPENFSLF